MDRRKLNSYNDSVQVVVLLLKPAGISGLCCRVELHMEPPSEEQGGTACVHRAGWTHTTLALFSFNTGKGADTDCFLHLGYLQNENRSADQAEIKLKNPQAADSSSRLAHRRRRVKREARKTEGLWMSSSKEIMQFRGALLNPVTCQLFQLFLSTKGDFLENDLRFWLEVQRYKDLCHSHSGEATIQKKVSTIISCFINSSMPPALQIHIPPEEAQNILDNRDELGPYVFREAQMSVFRELLKHWPEFEKLKNNMEEEQLVPLLQEEGEKYRARVRRQRRKEEDARRAWEELQSRDSSSIEGEDTDSEEETEDEQDGGNERKQSKKQSKFSFSYSKYMEGLMEEEVTLRKHSQSSSSSVSGGRRVKRAASCSSSLTGAAQKE